MYLGKRPAYGSMLKTTTSPKKAQNSKWREDRDGMDAKHVINIRDLPCCVPSCSKKRAGTIHHLKDVKEERGASVRATDKFGVPMCPAHHEAIEQAGTKNETRWFSDQGIDVKGLARALWNSRENVKGMAGVVNTHKTLAMKNA